jgi:hypothetical protein
VNYGTVAARRGKYPLTWKSWRSSAKPALPPFHPAAMSGYEVQLMITQELTLKWWSMGHKQKYVAR